MSVLVILESNDGKINKTAFEVCTYGNKTAKAIGTSCKALILGSASNGGEAGVYGADEVYQIDIPSFDSKVYTSVISSFARQSGATTLIMRHNSTAKNIAGRLAVRMDAGLVSGAKSIPQVTGDSLLIEKSVYSGKAIATYEIEGTCKIITVMGNTIQPEASGSKKDVSAISVTIPSATTQVCERKTITGVVPLPEAEMVVSAGRGMKGPENWGIIEELATTLGATTACSRPVADAHWRPHHEHVGQTGVAIRPNLYFAIGISGAIQHLAGVNSSKTIVVINKDPEAPFFKAADYGVVGDLFEVVPKLTEAIRKFKQG
jgi:electron transfer flavoprotein alpha subunit